ncbi:DNA repair and meiosis protein (Mre11) isoform X2 [Wolffia australiana]
MIGQYNFKLFGHVNYEDPHFNVGLPVFSIHGNHDDPAGVDNLSAMDILSACNLVNYFGKTVLGGSGVGQICIHPILIKKGTTFVALYGLGNIRDERLNRMFQTPHAVQWIRPEAQEGCNVSDWFNILVLHQNRIKANPKNAINEHFLPRFLDFIVWGHEHECLIEPKEVPGMGFHISQPGSSVATSLIDGESKPKHVLLLEIKGTQYRSSKIPLKSVRPFEYAEVVLKDVPEINPNDQNSVLEYLDNFVGKIIEESGGKEAYRSEVKLPLVRVKVDYSGFMTINPQRFGQKYVGKVANPQDILIFSKSAKKRQMGEKINDDLEKLRPEELNQQNIEALLAESNLKMEILPVNELDIALHDFVSKDDRMAFYSCLQHTLEDTRSKLSFEPGSSKFEEGDLVLRVEQCMQQRVKERSVLVKDKAWGVSRSQTPLEDGLACSSGNIGRWDGGFDDEEVAKQLPFITKSTATRERKASSSPAVSKTGMGRGRGRGRASSTGMKQLTIDSTMVTRHSDRSASMSASAAIQNLASDSGRFLSSDDESEDTYIMGEGEEAENNSGTENARQRVGRKRAGTTRGRGRGPARAPKRGRKGDGSTSSIHDLLMTRAGANGDQDDDDDDDDVPGRSRIAQIPAARNYGALRRR